MDIEALLTPFVDLAEAIREAAPRTGAALLLLAVGLALSLLLRALVGRFLAWQRADRRLAKLWIFRFWSRSHQGQSPSQSLASLAFYSSVLLVLALALHLLGEGMGRSLLAPLLQVLPRLLSAFLILMLSGLLAAFASLVVQMVLAGSELGHGLLWGKVAAWTTFGAGVVLALEPLGLAGQLLTQVLLILLASAGLALGLAFGLGCKDLARETLIELLAEGKGKPGK